MTDPDERIINRAICYVGAGGPNTEPMNDFLQDVREEARAALHRLFRDRRRLEKEVEGWRETHSTLVKQYNDKVDELARLRRDYDALQQVKKDALDENARLNAAHLDVNTKLLEAAKEDQAEVARLREENSTLWDQLVDMKNERNAIVDAFTKWARGEYREALDELGDR